MVRAARPGPGRRPIGGAGGSLTYWGMGSGVQGLGGGAGCAGCRLCRCGRDGRAPASSRAVAVGGFRCVCRALLLDGSGHAAKCLLRRQAESQRDTAHLRRVKPSQTQSNRVKILVHRHRLEKAEGKSEEEQEKDEEQDWGKNRGYPG